MRRRNFIAALPLLLSKVAFGQDTGKLNGIWEVHVPSKGSSGQTRVVMMRQMGGTLKVRDLQTGQDYVGTVSSTGIKFPLNFREDASQPPYNAAFAGAISQGLLQGQIELDGSKYQWVATRLTSLWICSNHNPNHLVKSKEDMLKFTQQNKCEGWQRPRPETLGS